MNEQAVKRKGRVKDVATVLNVPNSWVYGRTRKKTIPYLQVGKYCRFDMDEIERWAKAGCPENWVEVDIDGIKR
jgi:excisionase family DNA binding protein